MKPFLAMVKANLKMTVRNRQALFWNLAFPAIFILIFGAVFGNGDTVTFGVGVTGAESQYRDAVIAALESDESFDVHVGEQSSEERKLRDNDREFVLVFSGQDSEQSAVPVQILYDETQGPIGNVGVSVLTQVLSVVAGFESTARISSRPIETLNIRYIDFFVPGILAMALMNSGVIGLSTAFTTYREKGILRRIKVTPFSLTSFILARIVTTLIVAVLQSVVLLALGRVVYGLHIRGDPFVILVAIIVGAFCFLSIGFALSGIARNTETAASYANLITFPMLFLSGTFFPVDTLPAWLQALTRILPLRYLVDALREPIMRNKGFGTIWADLAIMLAVAVVAMAIAVRFFKWESRPS